jgi:Leucine-rich repeat (LRR) protein
MRKYLKSFKSVSWILFLFGLFVMHQSYAQTLNPPQNLTYVVEDENDVKLFWNQPSTGDSVYLHWDSGEYEDSYGFLLGPEEWSVACRWDTSNLAPYNSWIIKKIRFFVITKPYKLVIKIWTGDNPVEVYSQEVEFEQYNELQWSEVELDQPFVINSSEELRVGLYFNMLTPGAVMGMDDGPEIDGYGNWYLWKNQWYKQGAGNWNLQVFAEKPLEPLFLHWDNGHEDANAFGMDDVEQYSCAAKWDPGSLTGYEGWKISSMRFYIQNTTVNDLKLKIWTGSEPTEVYSQDVSNYNVNDWTEIELDTPYEINADEQLFAGLYVDVPAGSSVIGADAGPLVDGYGFWLYHDGTWYTAQEAEMQYNMNLQIKVNPPEQLMSPGSVNGLMGYNIYRDDVLLTPEPISPTVFLDENLFNGYYDYYVTAVYDEGESDPSNTVTVHINQPVILEQDSLALVDLYNQCNGPNWFLQDGWFQLPLNEWQGITTEGNRVVKVWLQLNNLTGDIPESFGNLTALRNCYLTGNDITSLPETIGNLDSLEWFRFSYSLISELPESFGNLSKLEDLDFIYTNITSFPESFCNLSSLKYFSMGYNNIAELPANFGNLTSLEYFSANQCSLTGLPDSFGDLSNLYYLNLQENQISSLPGQFGNLKKLAIFYVNYNNLSELPDSFGELENLWLFVANNNKITYLPDNFGDLDNLSLLFLPVNQITSLPESFSDLATLDSCMLGYNGISQLPTDFGDLDDLKYFEIVYNQLTSLPESFGDLSSLQELYLSVNQLTTLPESFTNLNTLTSASIAVNLISSLPQNFDNMTNLQMLNLNDNELTSVPESIGDMPSLTGLGLASNHLTELPESIGNLNLTALVINDNYLTELPESMFDNSFEYLYVYNNRLQFGSLEPFAYSVQYYQYAPQDEIGNDTIIELNIGEDFLYTIDVSGDYNSYQWYKDGNLLSGQTTNTLTIDNVGLEDIGSYELKVSNGILSELVLESKPVVLSVIDAVDENVNAEFSVFPNPISSGTVTVSLPEPKNVEMIQIIDLQGKVIKEDKNVSSNNRIDVTDINSGMYILKISSENGKNLSKKIIVR